jgi:hypothetical protein
MVILAAALGDCTWAQSAYLNDHVVEGPPAGSDTERGGRLRPEAEGEPTWLAASLSDGLRPGPLEGVAPGEREPQAGAGAPPALDAGIQAGAQGGSDVASDFTNPTKLLTSYQFNTWYHPSFYGAVGSGTEFLVRPVIPVPKSALIPADQIVRIEFPVESMPHLPNGLALPNGFMDVQVFDLAVFPLSRDLTLAAGAITILPVATSPVTGQGRWQFGPAFAGVYTGIPKWQMGLLLQNSISLGSSEWPAVSQTFYNLILTRHFEQGWYGSLMGATGTYDWRAHELTVPVSASLGRVFSVGKQPVNFSVTPAYYANGPALTPKLELEFNFALIYR